MFSASFFARCNGIFEVFFKCLKNFSFNRFDFFVCMFILTYATMTYTAILLFYYFIFIFFNKKDVTISVHTSHISFVIGSCLCLVTSCSYWCFSKIPWTLLRHKYFCFTDFSNVNRIIWIQGIATLFKRFKIIIFHSGTHIYTALRCWLLCF